MENICIYLAIRLIRAGEPSSLYKLHSHFRLTYTQTVKAVTYLESIGIVDFDGKIFSLKKDVTRHQLTELYTKIRYRKLRLDEEALDCYKKMAINPSSLYFPKLSHLDSSLVIDD